MPGVGVLTAQRARHGDDIVHQPRGVMEHIAVDLLQNVQVRTAGHQQIGFIDVPAAVARTADGQAVQGELTVDVFHGSFPPQVFGI